MEPREVLAADQIDLSDIGFWERPLDEREGRRRALRRERPLAFFKEPPVLPELSLFVPEGPGYRAVTRHAHIVEVSRHPEIYQSGKGATSIPDMPEELLEYFGSMVNTDNPRHAQLRRIVSAAFSPRMIKSIEDRIELVANQVIDRIATKGGCDFVVDVATQLPLRDHLRHDGHRPHGLRHGLPRIQRHHRLGQCDRRLGTRSISPPMPIP